MQQNRRNNNGYVFDEKGNIVAWVNPNLKGSAADYESQINELRADLEALKQKQEKEDRAAPVDCEIQVNTKQIERAAADVKKEIDKALKNLF